MRTKFDARRKIFLGAAGIAAVLCAALLIPFVQNAVLLFGQKFLLHRTLRKPEKLFFYMKALGIGGFCGFASLCLLAFFGAEEKIESLFTKKGKIIAVILIAVYAAVAAALAFMSRDIWYDEAYTVSLCSHSFPEVIALTAQDVHPPLYYLLLKFFTLIFGTSVYAMRFFSAIPVVIFMIIGLQFLSREFSPKAAAVFELFALASGSLLAYSHEIRMYSWPALFCAMCGIFSYYILRREKFSDWIFYVIFAVCSAYAQYFAAVLVLCNFIPLCLCKFIKSPASRKYIFASCALGILLFAPWVPTVIAQFTRVSENFWIEKPTFMIVLGWLNILSPGAGYFSYAGLLFMLALLCVFVFSQQKTFWQILCAVSPLAQIFIGLLLSIIVRPIFVDRYAFHGIFLILLSASLIVANLRDKRIFMAALVVLLGFSLISAASNFRVEEKCSENYEEFISAVAPKINDDTKFILVENDGNSFTGHQRGILATLFPSHRIYRECADSPCDDKWAYLFNSEFLPLERAEFDSPLCVVTENSRPDYKQAEFIARLVNDENWRERDFLLVSPSFYEKYCVYFFE